MYTHSPQIVEQAGAISAALRLEPSVRLDLTLAGVPTVAAFIFAVLWNEIDQSGLYACLHDHGCRFDRDTINFILDVFEGDDPQRHLWSVDEDGMYQPHFDIVSDDEMCALL